MALLPEEVKRIANLARLPLSEEEIIPFTEKLSTILGMVEHMESADIAQVEPLSHPLDLHQRFRDDVVTVLDEREAFQRIAPAVLAGLYLVPIVKE